MALRRRLEDRIQELCEKVVSAQDSDEVQTMIQQLNEALKEHQRRAQARLTKYAIVPERRA